MGGTLARSGGRGTPARSRCWGGGTPSQVNGGVPQPSLDDWGVIPGTLPQTWDGVPPQTWHGVPPNLGCGIPWTWDRVPSRHGMGYPWDLGWGTPLDMGWGTPRTLDGVPPPRQISIASTCYTAGGMPLAFTQEDFLVFFITEEIGPFCNLSLVTVPYICCRLTFKNSASFDIIFPKCSTSGNLHSLIL